MKAIKALIIILAVVGLGIVVFFGGIYLFVKVNYSEEKIEEIQKQLAIVREEAKLFGEKNENIDCIQYVLPKINQCGNFDINCQIYAQAALSACLESSKVTLGFCDDVPLPDDQTASINWYEQICTHYKIEELKCSQFEAMQNFCHGLTN